MQEFNISLICDQLVSKVTRVVSYARTLAIEKNELVDILLNQDGNLFIKPSSLEWAKTHEDCKVVGCASSYKNFDLQRCQQDVVCNVAQVYSKNARPKS